MRTAHLQTVRASVTTARCRFLVEGLWMNKFEQVSSDNHQMWLAGGITGLMSKGQGVAMQIWLQVKDNIN